MTKRLLLIVLVLTAFTAGAQFRYGLRLGGSFAAARLSGAPGYSLSNRSGFSGGLDLEYQMPGNGFAADIAVLYTRFNSRLRADDAPMASFGRNFIEIPLHFKYKFWLKSTKRLVAPLVYTGPSLMLRLGHGSSRPLETNMAQPGWDVGVGFDIVNFIQITGGYRFGLGNARKRFEECLDSRLRTNGWNIAATILFDF